jgi:LysR family transcriptional regulator, benzoate and cis,cis-muconate-responsive activator of ben and cat genes
MELRHLRYFVAVAEEGSFRLAAIRLNLSQPPLSRQIQQLEEQVGAVLLDRTAGGVELTEAGAVFLEEATRILSLAKEAVGKARRIEQGEQGHLNVAYYGSVIFKVIPRILTDFRELRSRISVSLRKMAKDEQIRALRQGWIDIGFGRSYRPEPDMLTQLVLDEPLLVAVSRRHEFSGRQSVALRELANSAFVVYPGSPRPGFADEVIMLCDKAGFRANIAEEADDVDACLALVSADVGVGLVPASAVSAHNNYVRFIRLANPRPTSPLWCVVRRNDERPSVRTFLETVKQFDANERALDVQENHIRT